MSAGGSQPCGCARVPRRDLGRRWTVGTRHRDGGLTFSDKETANKSLNLGDSELAGFVARGGLPVSGRPRRWEHAIKGFPFMSRHVGSVGNPLFTLLLKCEVNSNSGKHFVVGSRYGRRPHPTLNPCLLYTSPSPRDGLLSRMPSSA